MSYASVIVVKSTEWVKALKCRRHSGSLKSKLLPKAPASICVQSHNASPQFVTLSHENILSLWITSKHFKPLEINSVVTLTQENNYLFQLQLKDLLLTIWKKKDDWKAKRNVFNKKIWLMPMVRNSSR